MLVNTPYRNPLLFVAGVVVGVGMAGLLLLPRATAAALRRARADGAAAGARRILEAMRP